MDQPSPTPTRTFKPRRATVTTTAAVSMTAANGACVLIWAFHCVAEGRFIEPDATTSIQIFAFIAPIVHGLREKFLGRLNNRS